MGCSNSLNSAKVNEHTEPVPNKKEQNNSVKDLNKMKQKDEDIHNIDLTNVDEQKNEDNNISFTCVYDIKDYNYTQIINNQFEDYLNEEIESKIKIINNNKKEKNFKKKKFNKLGRNAVNFLIEGEIYDTSFMFNDCISLVEIKFISIDFGKVKDTIKMFHGCRELELLDLSHFDTSNVINMAAMFDEC